MLLSVVLELYKEYSLLTCVYKKSMLIPQLLMSMQGFNNYLVTIIARTVHLLFWNSH